MATSRRARALAQARQAAADAAFIRRCKALVRLFRHQAGIPVRQPTHQTAPFRSVPINVWGSAQVTQSSVGWGRAVCPVLWQPTLVGQPSSVGVVDAGYGAANGTANTMNVTGTPLAYNLDQRPQFPDGYLGVITNVSCYAFPIMPDAINQSAIYLDVLQLLARYSWYLDDAPVPGYQGALPTLHTGISDNTSIAAPVMGSGDTIKEQLGCHVLVRAGQRSHIEAAAYLPSDAASQSSVWAFFFRVIGYAVPTKSGSDQTIFDTLTD